MLDKISSSISTVEKTLAAQIMAVMAWAGLDIKTRAMQKFLFGPQRGQLGFRTIVAAVVVVITVMLGVIVVDQFDQSLGTPNSSSLSQANNDVLTGFGDMVSLIGPLLLVSIAVVIIGLVQRIRGQ